MRTPPEKANAALAGSGAAKDDAKSDAAFLQHSARPSQASADDAEDFNWLDDDSVIIREQPAIATFRNRFGDIVVAQQGHYGPDEDKHLFLRPENVLTLIKALAREAGWGDVDIVPKTTEKPQAQETDEPPLLRIVNRKEVVVAAE